MNQTIDPAEYERYARVARQITNVYSQVISALDTELAPFDITAAQFVVVSLIARGYAESAAQICKELSYNPGAMTRMLDRLEEKQFIARVRMPNDRRAVRLELSEYCKTLFPQMQASSAKVLDRYYGGFSHAELSELSALLGRMID